MLNHFFILLSAIAFSISSYAETYKLDVKTSSIGWLGSKAIGSSHNGKINIKDGSSVVVKNGSIESGTIIVDMNTLSNEDLKSDAAMQKKLEGHLKSEDFFNVTKFSESTFKITGFQKKSDTEATIKGDLTILGKTNPVEFPAKIKMDKDSLTGQATLKIDRTKWNLKYGSGKFFKNLGDKVINDEFELTLNLIAKKS